MAKKACSNIVLIGMPGSGKSTVGKQLARRYNLEFIDGDFLIEAAANMSIQSIVDNWGLKRFNRLEQEVLCDLNVNQSLVSTGGSAVYSDAAMHHLGNIGLRVYLRITPYTMLRRINNASTRGLFKLPGHSLMRLYEQRKSMYPRHAAVTFDNDRPFTAQTANVLYAIIEGPHSAFIDPRIAVR